MVEISSKKTLRFYTISVELKIVDASAFRDHSMMQIT